MIVPVASAQTVDINALLAQIAQLQALVAQLQAAQGGAVAACSFTKDLTVGSTGEDVRCLQKYLNAAGHQVAASGVGSAGNETTYFGSLTRAAVAKWQAANSVSPAVGYFGSISRAKYTAVAGATTVPGAPGVPGVPVPASGLAFSLAADTPASGGAVPKAAATVPYMKFNVAGNGTVNTITIRRTGAGATDDFTNVYLYEGQRRLTTGRSLNSTSHEATFTGLELAVAGVRTLTVAATMATTPGASNRNAFSVVSVQASVAVSGVPVSGFELVNSSAAAGTITLDKTGSIANPNAGQSDAQVSEFRLTASTEDANVSRIALFHGGTVSKSNLTNFKLKDISGNVVASASGIDGRDLVVFDLNPTFKVPRGENKLFRVYADVSPSAKKDDTIKFYVEEAADLLAIGQQYGYGMTATVTSMDTAGEAHALTLQGAKFTIVLNGPTAGDIPVQGKDVVLFDFTLSAANNVEVRKINASFATGSIAGDDTALTDFKIVDVATGVTVAGPVDVATGSAVKGMAGGITFSDVFVIKPGEAKRLKFTADIPSDWDTSDTIRVDLAAFTASQDLKNLDNNQFLVAADISPSTKVTGNTQTVKKPTLALARAGLPVSQSFVKGAQDIPFVGLSLTATGDDLTVKTIKVTASSASVTDDDMIADILSLALYDGTTRVSEIKGLTSVDASSSAATFSSLDFKITKGQTKVLTVKGNLNASAVTNNKYELGIAAATTTNGSTGNDVVAVDSNGTEPYYGATASVNMSSSVAITVLSAGSVTIATGANNQNSKAKIVVAGTSKIPLAEFEFTAANENLTVKKLKLLVNQDNSTAAAATSTDEVLRVYLYDVTSGSVQVGDPGGYVPIGGGSTAGDVAIEFGTNSGWVLQKDVTRKLQVSADFATIDAGADTGTSIYVHIQEDGFSADGASANVAGFSNAGGAKGRQNVVYKTKPTLTALALDTTTLTGATDLQIAKFTVGADSAFDIAWASIGFRMTLTNASFSDVALSIRDLTNNLDLTVSTQANSPGSTDITGDGTRNAIIQLSSPEQIAKGTTRTYEVKLNATAAQFGTANELEVLTVTAILYSDSATSNILNATTFSRASNSTTPASGTDKTIDGDSAFVWTDMSLTGTEDADEDWANGVYVDTFPSTPVWERKR